MTIHKEKRVTDSEESQHASAEDLRQVFSDDMDALYRLSFLLTGDHEKAEQCFVAGVEGSVNTNRVFKEWARTWAKRAIIQSALRALQPRPRQHTDSSLFGRAVNINGLRNIPDRDVALSTVLALEEFERFVFVLIVLEGYSEHDCALLLNSSIGDVRNARIRATEQLAAAESSPIVASHGSTDMHLNYLKHGAILPDVDLTIFDPHQRS